jgi:hypothetical protein
MNFATLALVRRVFTPFLWLFMSLGLLACGSGPAWDLRLSSESAQEPEFVLLIRMDDPSAGADPEALIAYTSNIELPPSGRDGSFQPAEYSRFLRGCAIEEDLVEDPDLFGADFDVPANSCIQLGQYFGETVFGGLGFETEEALIQRTQLALRPDSRFVFVLVFYPPTQGAFGNCFQIQGAEVLKAGFRIRKASAFQITKAVEISLPEPDAENCYVVAGEDA